MVKFNKFRRNIFRLDKAVLNFVTGVTEWVMTEQNKKFNRTPTKYREMDFGVAKKVSSQD